MQLPILSYGHKILTQRCKNIESTYPQLQKLIDDMWETLYRAEGCGLSAPQVNHPVRLFLVDSQQTYAYMQPEERKKYFRDNIGIRETFINARIITRSQESWTDTEGCLSIPSLRKAVERPWQITIEYLDRQFQKQQKTFSGLTARMVQHEFDHTEGVLYLHYFTSFQRALLTNQLKKIAEGRLLVPYPMKFLK